MPSIRPSTFLRPNNWVSALGTPQRSVADYVQGLVWAVSRFSPRKFRIPQTGFPKGHRALGWGFQKGAARPFAGETKAPLGVVTADLLPLESAFFS